MKIGVLSDTHGHLPGRIFDVFAGVDIIIHAGDICDADILTDLAALAPVRAVYGNMDQAMMHGQLKRVEFIEVEGQTICVTHIVQSKKNFAYELLKMGRKPQVVIYGHTHMPDAHRFNGILFLNPGSAVQPRGGSFPSVAILTVQDGKAEAEFIKIA